MTFAPSHCIASHKGRGSGIIWGGGSNPDNAWMYINLSRSPIFTLRGDFSTEYCHDLPPKMMCNQQLWTGIYWDTAGPKSLVIKPLERIGIQESTWRGVNQQKMEGNVTDS